MQRGPECQVVDLRQLVVDGFNEGVLDLYH